VCGCGCVGMGVLVGGCTHAPGSSLLPAMLSKLLKVVALCGLLRVVAMPGLDR